MVGMCEASVNTNYKRNNEGLVLIPSPCISLLSWDAWMWSSRKHTSQGHTTFQKQGYFFPFTDLQQCIHHLIIGDSQVTELCAVHLTFSPGSATARQMCPYAIVYLVEIGLLPSTASQT